MKLCKWPTARTAGNQGQGPLEQRGHNGQAAPLTICLAAEPEDTSFGNSANVCPKETREIAQEKGKPRREGRKKADKTGS